MSMTREQTTIGEGPVDGIDAMPVRAAGLRPGGRAVEWALTILVGLGFLGAWVVLSTQVSPFVFPAPDAVFRRFGEMLVGGAIWRHVWTTLFEILAGFVLGSVLGIGLGTILARSRMLRNVLNVYIVMSQAIPKLALAPIFAIWFGFGMEPKIIMAALISFFPLLENTVVGLQTVDKDALTMFRSLCASESQTFLKLRFPHALPYIFAGLRVAMVFATVGAIVAEYVGANQGLGAQIIVAQGTMNTTNMFAIFIFLVAIGYALFKLVDVMEAVLLGRRFLR